MALQVRVFHEVSEAGIVPDSQGGGQAQANAFLASVPRDDVADVRVTVMPFGKYGERTLTTITVVYLE